jgi:hypothetical protein
MPKFDFYPSFNAGEVSPFIDARTSLEKYRSACRTLENFQILPYGGVIRRPGTQFLGATKSATGQTRLIGFNFSTTTRFMIEMGVGYMRFWYPNGTPVGGATPFEVSTPYTGAQLREIQYAQINDIMYFTHEDHPPHKLSRLSDTNWTFAPVKFGYPPLLDMNSDDNLGLEFDYNYGNATAYAKDANLNPISNFFTNDYNGSQWAVQWPRASKNLEFTIGGSNWASGVLDLQGAYTLTTIGRWIGRLVLYRIPADKLAVNGPEDTASSITRSGTTATVTHTNHGYATGDLVYISTATAAAPLGDITLRKITRVDANTYTYTVANTGATSATNVAVENVSKMEKVKIFDSAGEERNFVFSGNEADRAGLKIHIEAYTSATNAKVIIDANESNSGGTFTINSPQNSGQEAAITVNNWLGMEWFRMEGSTVQRRRTTQFSEAAFSAKRGYPRAVCFHESRLCFGGTASQPTTIWCSEIDNFENFKIGNTASDAVQFTLAASEGNRITWMYSQAQMLVGTSGDEWTIGSADSSQALSATNVEARRQSSYGSKYMKAALVNDVLLFVQRNGRKVRELVYELNKDGWVAPDLTLLAEHITNGEIVDIAYQQQPDAVLWCVRGDGTLIAMTYERDQKVVGWHRHTLGDADVESVATIYGNGTEDEVWMVVKRYVGIVAGQRVQFTNLPAGSNISSTETYVVLSNPSGNTFTIGSLIGESLGIANSSITPNTTQVVVVNGSFSAPVSSLSVGTFTYTGNAAATVRTVERFPLLWRKHIDDQTAKEWRYLDGHVDFPSGATGTSIIGLGHLKGKSVTVMFEDGTKLTQTVSTAGTIGRGSKTSAGYAGQPYTSTLRPMKLDADFEDGTAQSRKKRIHQIVVRTLKSRGGEVRTNSGSWYALAPTTTTGDQKIILGGAFGIDADVDVRQTEPYPMCIISILPKWDAYGNE